MSLLRSKAQYWPIFVLVLITVIFFRPFIFQGKLPIPSDTIIGLYHPFRDLYVKDYPNGIPFKNFLITDPVRQQYPWRELSIGLWKKGELPFWNPYTFGGTPLLANHQSAPFYPLNLLFFILPFSSAWSILILFQSILTWIFMYWYLRNLNVGKVPALLGGIVLAFSGFSIAWLEWGTILHSALWLPLLLLSIDKIIALSQPSTISNIKYQISNIQIKNKKLLTWGLIFIFSLASSFFAGHLQTFFYVVIVSIAYLIARWIQYGKPKKVIFQFTIYYLLFTIATAIQWIPMVQFIFESARNLDQSNWQNPGWFIPWQHLIQFVAPDFFGNPATLNYWGEWNYAEFVGYVGIAPLIFAIAALVFRHDKKTIFYGSIFFLSLLFALPTIFAKLPFTLNIPFLSTAQPTRLIFITDFSLAVLAALGFEQFLRRRKGMAYILGFLSIVFVGLWTFALFGKNVTSLESIDTARRNLILPTGLFVGGSLLLFLFSTFSKSKRATLILYCILVAVVGFDLLRFAEKFTPFTESEYLFPQTKALEFLKQKEKEEGLFRIMTTDGRIFPPNFSAVYRLQTVDGYDPLYLQRYAELIAASERGEPNIDPPFGFNRIITPKNFDSKIIDLLGVKYVLSLVDIFSPKLAKVFQEGQTRVYENNKALPRAFFVEEVIEVKNQKEAIRATFMRDFDPKKTAVIEDDIDIPLRVGNIEIKEYSENTVVLEVENTGEGFLVLTDSFYPTWRAKIDGIETKIYRTDYHFRGIIVPKGKHKVTFSISLL